MKYFVLILLCLAVLSCQNKEVNTTETIDLISQYLTERVSPVINVDEDIVLRFNKNEEIAAAQLPQNIRFSPSIKGTFRWIDDHSLLFDPEEYLDYDQTYSMSVDLSEIMTGTEVAELMRLNFQTAPLQLEMQQINHKMIADDDVVTVSIGGTITSNQFASGTDVARTLQSQSDTKEVEINWNHHSSGRIHEFVITGIEQQKKEQDITLTWEGAGIAPQFRGRKTITIKGEKEFGVDDVVLHNDPVRHIVVLFSQPLDNDQDLRGLVKINNESKSSKLLVEGNELKVYPDGDLSRTFELHLSKSIRSYRQSPMSEEIVRAMSIESSKPELRLSESGVIVPSHSKVTFPFEAINIDTVDIEIFKIYDQNILQFMQENDLRGNYNLEQVGKIVYQEKMSIKEVSTPINTWRSIALDLQDYFVMDDGAIYQVRIGFRPSYVTYDCSEAIIGYRPFLKGPSIMQYHYYGYDGWDNPCSAAYYTTDKYVRRNVIVSDVAAIIKGDASNNYNVAVNKISDGESLSGAAISFFNFQKVVLGSLSTDSKGVGNIKLEEKASFAIVRHESGVAYVNVRDPNAKSVTDFNTGGKKSKNGIDAYIYTDRGVYRPGDTIYMHAMLLDGSKNLPKDHPVVLSVRDAQGQLKYRRSTIEHLDDIYTFQIPTDTDDGTGAWNATLEIGSVLFSKRLSVETVKPNRLRLSLDMDKRISYTDKESREIHIESSWLHGAPASNLRTKIDAQWSTLYPRFEKYDSYAFSDPARRVSSGQVTLYDGRLDEKGTASFELLLDKNRQYPAMLRANITNRVFEKGGDFSENYDVIEVSPYSAYVGVSMPENSWGYKSVKIGDEAIATAVVLNEDGSPAINRKLSIGVYDIDWNWWYYRGRSNDLYELNSDQHSKAIIKSQATSGSDGMVEIPINTEDFESGRKLIRICDLESGHCTGDFFYASGWRSSMSSEERGSLSRLSFSADKESYEVGEEVTLNIPSQAGSKILISIEGEDKVVAQDKVTGATGSTVYKFKTDATMAPNVYAYVSLIQPYDQVENDLPIRMYGVIPIMISDPGSTVSPTLSIPDELKPEESFKVAVGEKDGRPMSYTIAIVDDGLLDLTNFKSPNPHDYFYAKRSLGVKTWDIYDDVLYGLNGTPDKIISIGGDGDGSKETIQKKAIRFKPVVFSAGPFRLEKGKLREHTFIMPNYIGSVRTMIVAREENAFGSISTSVPVKTPLMLLPTVPRVISQGERIRIPVSVFSMQDDIKEVNVAINTSQNITTGSPATSLTFDQQGEQVVYFDTDVGEELGIARIDVRASSGGHQASQQIEVDIRNPNPVISEVSGTTIQPGETWVTDYEPFGVTGTNAGILELSLMPSVRLADRVDYLVDYPYGCLEQTTSSAFVQLYLKELTDYVSDATIDRNINAGIKRILKMQSGSGGFKYWPSSNSKINSWSSSYAGHFLIEARKKGYYVSGDILERWSQDQSRRASKWELPKEKHVYWRKQEMLTQSYRLYTLALHGAPDLSAMNNLRSLSDLTPTAKFVLAAAYAITSKSNIALDLIKGVNTDVANYRDRGYTYGSDVRDMALISQALTHIDRRNQSLEVIKKIVDRLNSNRWYSTQSIAFGLMAVGQLSEEYRRSTINASITMGDNAAQEVNYNKAIFTMDLSPGASTDRRLIVKNNADKVLFVSLQLTGQKSPREMLAEEAVQENVAISVNYKNLDGSKLDVGQLKQGTDFIAEVNIKNLNTLESTIPEMALVQIIPSGWEIRSGRLNAVQGFTQDSYEYRDIRDDRIHTFFDLGARKKYVLLLNAAYEGEYFLPPVSVEAMYDKNVRARTKGMKVQVLRQ